MRLDCERVGLLCYRFHAHDPGELHADASAVTLDGDHSHRLVHRTWIRQENRVFFTEFFNLVFAVFFLVGDDQFGCERLDLIQALHGRAPSVATGAKRMRPDSLLFTLQGDGDMVNEGLQEVVHTAARGENVTCVLLNNGVFGETGGHMTATTVLGQRTKNSLDGRDASYHGHPILIGDLLARLGGTAYAARGSVHDAAGVARTKRYFQRAFESQMRGEGFSFVEVLTMCPTGWFVPTKEGPDYLDEVLGSVHEPGELKVDGVLQK